MLEKFLIFIVMVSCFSGVALDLESNPQIPEEKVDIGIHQFSNVLEVRNIPTKPKDRDAFCFSDLGAWFGFALPDFSHKEFYGSFIGPYLITSGQWLGQSLLQIEILDDKTQKIIDFAQCQHPDITFSPGLLSQNFRFPKMTVSLDLFFINSSHALVQVGLVNKSSQDLQIKLKWKGQAFLGSTKLSGNGNGIMIFPEKGQLKGTILLPKNINTHVVFDNNKAAYKLTLSDPVRISPEGKYLSHLIFAMQAIGADDITPNHISSMIQNSEGLFQKNSKRWLGYLRAILGAQSLWAKKKEYRKIAVKALLTLVNNWQGGMGDLYHDGVIPSYSPGYFNGFWAWDSWKHAVALAEFEPELAKNQVRTMFDYQDDRGMVADCIYIDKKENNYRDTKPPLAAWAVWNIYGKTTELKFLEEIYPKLEKYHYWWYKDRDHDENLLCEYGSTDGTLKAAKWESGMDNAVRFDLAKMVKNNNWAWSMNLESVDLNSYLYAEKCYLASIAEVLKREPDAQKLKKEAARLKDLIQSRMFDKETGYFYDIWLENKAYHRVQGPEGWIPLWAGVASKDQADRVKSLMVDSKKFATYVPFPTVARDHPQFSTKYWRGPVWLDQAYFAIAGLRRYGYKKEAIKFTGWLFDHPEGLKDSTAPIRENYHPLTGEGLNVNHFSWSAAHLLLLFMGK
jgi:putative isomerase